MATVNTTSFYEEDDATNEFEIVISTTSFSEFKTVVNVTNEFETAEYDQSYQFVLLLALIGFAAFLAIVDTLLFIKYRCDIKNRKKHNMELLDKNWNQLLKSWK